MPGDTCEKCGHKPKNPTTLFYSAMLEQTLCVDGAACLRRVERQQEKAGGK